MEKLLRQIADGKLVPVIKLDRAEDAAPLGEALIAGGLPVAEITFRTAAAPRAIENLLAAQPGMLVGAGTITNVEQARIALGIGCAFLVTPGFSRAVTEFALQHALPIFPGVCTPTELMMLLEYDLPVAKFFPAAQYGGVATIKALSAPFPAMRFMPTGGVSAGNIREYLACDKVIACGGSWMVKDSLIAARDFGEIARLTAEAVALIH